MRVTNSMMLQSTIQHLGQSLERLQASQERLTTGRAVTRPSDDRVHRSMHGLTRTLVANMIEGVSNGYSKELEVVGVGWKAETKGKELVLTLGYSHPIHYPAPEGISIETPEPTKIKVSGIDKQQVGQVAAEIREFRRPEPYKGKGVKYVDEQIQRKAGKTAVGGS